MRLESPLALLLLVFAPLLLEPGVRTRFLTALGVTQLTPNPRIALSTPLPLTAIVPTFRARHRGTILSVLMVTAFALLVAALARPQTGTYFAESLSSGRDLMFALDVSGSMEALDFSIDGKPVTRLEALKHVTKEFINKRRGDRMGLVLFGTNVYTQCPLTLDQTVLAEFVDGIEIGMVGDGTAIGDALAVALKRVKDIDAESKVLILITDGLQTAGSLDPIEAAGIAKELKIKVHTIGVGGTGPAPFRTKDAFGREVIQYADLPLDEKTLQKIADTTGGRFFNARDTESFAEVYAEIDKLEQREEKTLEFIEYQERYLGFVLAGLCLFTLHEVLAATRLLRVP